MVMRVKNWARNTLSLTPYAFGEGTCGKGAVFIEELFVEDMRFLTLSRFRRMPGTVEGTARRKGVSIFTHSSGGCTLLCYDAFKHRVPSFSVEFIYGKSGWWVAKQ